MDEQPPRSPRPLLECLDMQANFHRRNNNRTFQRFDSGRGNDENIEASPAKSDVGRSTIDIREPNPEHLHALQTAFDRILSERTLSEQSYKQRQIAFNKLRQLIFTARPDSQVSLYGSLLFECCLEKPGVMDIDVQFKQILHYDTLKELRDLISASNLCKEARIDTEHKPSCLVVTMADSNLHIHITAGYIRGLQLSKLIRLYTKADPRVTKLLRLVRILCKVCNIDKPDLGTLHPVVFHLMVIHFLQQLDPPVLPCLHEHIYGVDHVPITLSESQYPEFFRLATDVIRDWKSSNSTSVELLFLQFLSYYMKTFHAKPLVVSIQTRMPVVKIDKNWHSRKLLVEDPTDVKRSLCQTMQANRSLNYFRDTLNTALNYFARKQKKTRQPAPNASNTDSTDDDFIEVVAEDETEVPVIAAGNALHSSYQLFYKRLPPTVIRDVNIRQHRVRELYRKSFAGQLPEPLVKLNSLPEQQMANVDENEVEEALQHDLEHDFETMDANDDDEQSGSIVRDEDESFQAEFTELTIDNDLDSKPNAVRQLFPENSPTPTSVSEKEQGATDEKLEPVPSDLYYDFKAENFHAEQGAPFVCTTCNGVGHLKSECPDLVVPNMIDLPAMAPEWIAILSHLCQQITERCRPTPLDIENRERVLKQLRQQFERDFPECSLHAFGSFYNGFGFRQSDLDVCIVFNDQREENTDEVIQIMRKLLKSMRMNADTFENVQPVLHAKVPIIRSKHRRLQIEIDISLHNMLAIENTRLLRTYTNIAPCVSPLGYMIKHLTKTCDIADASRGTLSSYAYIIMVIHFLQQIQPPVLPVLQELSDEPTRKDLMFKKCSVWNVYFYADLDKLNTLWKSENHLSVGALWIEFLRFYTEQFNYDEHVVTIRQQAPLLKHEKGWFRPTIAIEDPFELSHNLAGGLSVRNWTMIRRVLIRARQQFGLQSKDIDVLQPDMNFVELALFNVDDLCPSSTPRRCADCKGPYHPRKRCPKTIEQANEKERLKRMVAAEQRRQHPAQPPIYPQFPSNNLQFAANPQFYYPVNAYQQPYAVMPQPRIWTHPYSTGPPPMVYPSFSFYAPQRPMMHNAYRSQPPNHARKRCYRCGSFDHLIGHCPQN